MTIVLQPSTTVNIIGATVSASNSDQKVLFVGQQGTGSSIVSGSLVENVLDNTEDGLFDADSMLAGMIRTARAQNKINQFDVIALDDNGSAVKAAGIVNFTGSTATEAGTVVVTIGSANDYALSIAVASGDSATVIGDALVTAITANLDIPVTAINTTGSVAITAVNGGTLGNTIGLSTSGTVAGVTVALTAFASGATDPVLTGIFDVIADNRYQAIVWPYFADTSELRKLLDARFNVSNKVIDGVGYTASIDTFANHLTRLNLLNSLTLVDFVDELASETAFKAPALFELPYIKSSQFAAIRALRLTDGASIASVVTATNGVLDSFGGPALASKPYFNTPMKDLPLTGTGRGFTETEIQQLHDAGGTVIGNNVTGNNVIVGEVVTTYKTDTAGNEDISFKFNNYVDTSSGAREYFFNNLKKRFSQSRLTTGDVIKGRDTANALTIKAECEKLYQDLSGPDFVLLEAGAEAVKFFKDNLIVTIDKALGRATITMVVPIVTQLREILATMQIAFETEG